MMRDEQLGEHLKAAIKGINESRTFELFGKTWQTFAVSYDTGDGSVELKLIPVLGAPTDDKPEGGAPLELEGLKFTTVASGVTWQHKGSVYLLTWAAARRLSDWLCVEVDKYRAPVAPTESLALRHQWVGRIRRPLYDSDLSPEALTAAVWSGEGLPPVGCVCEVQCADGGWHKCEIIAHHLDNAVFAPDANYPYGVYDGLPAGRFRPLRTAEQLAAEAREAAIAEMLAILNEWPNQHAVEKICTKFYDAGYRKEDA